MPATKDTHYSEEGLNELRGRVPFTSPHIRAIIELKLEFGSPVSTIVSLPWKTVNKKNLTINGSSVIGAREALRTWVDRHPLKHDDPDHLFVTIPKPHNKLKTSKVRDKINGLNSDIKGVSVLERLQATYEFRKNEDYTPQNCSNCGKSITGSGSYCRYCGFLIDSKLLRQATITERLTLEDARKFRWTRDVVVRHYIYGIALLLPVIKDLGQRNNKGVRLLRKVIQESKNIPFIVFSQLNEITEELDKTSTIIATSAPFLEDSLSILFKFFPELDEGEVKDEDEATFRREMYSDMERLDNFHKEFEKEFPRTIDLWKRKGTKTSKDLEARDQPFRS